MLRKAAQVSSYIFHPLLLPTFAFGMIFLLNPFLFSNISEKQKLTILLSIFLNTFFVPVFLTFLMVKLGFVKSLRLESKMERIIPIGISIFIYAGLFAKFRLLDYNPVLATTLLSATVLLIIIMIINMQWKVSIHSIGIAGLLGVMVSNIDLFSYSQYLHLPIGILQLLYLPLVIVTLVAGWVGTARLILGAHQKHEVYLGYIVGFVCTVLVFYLRQTFQLL